MMKKTPPRGRWRWTLMLPASVLLHLLALRWSGMQLDFLPPFAPEPPAVVTARLMAPVVMLPADAAPAAAPARPVRKPVRRRLPAAPASAPSLAGLEAPGPSAQPPTVLPMAAPADAANSEGPASADGVAAGSSAARPAQAATALPPTAPVPDPAPTPQAAELPATRRYAASPPPPAELAYKVEAVRDGQPVHGHGKIAWQTDGARYRVNGEAGILFFNVLEFTSEGTLETAGVAPETYTEKRFRKSATATHFHRERQQISFSASTATYPRQGSEQDRASVIWQLASIGRGDAAAFAPGNEFEVFVAAVRDGETWRLRVAGEETVETGDGAVQAWHVIREPRAGSYDQRLDIWLSPQRQWYPVQLRFTEKNGDVLTMSLSEAKPLVQAQNAN